MSVKGKRTIYVGPADGSNHKPLRVEGAKAGLSAIVPGETVRLVAGEFQRGNANGTAVLPMFADRNTLLQKGVDDIYDTNGENVIAIQPRSGEFINARIDDAQVLVVGTPLTVALGGSLRVALTDNTEQVVAYSDEALTTVTATLDQLVRVRIA